jgi:AcrR family transcriptional regulator
LTERATRRQERAAATAEQLLAAAREVFEAKGYQATTVGAITAAANTAHGTFYLYFKNKEDVFARVMASVVDEMYVQARSPWGDDPRETLAQATRGYLRVFEAHRGLWRCLLEGMHQSKAIEQMWIGLRRPFIDRVARNLDRSVESGLARPMNTEMAAHALIAMTEWSAFTHFEFQEPGPSKASTDELADTVTDLWYHAVYAGAYDAPRQPV